MSAISIISINGRSGSSPWLYVEFRQLLELGVTGHPRPHLLAAVLVLVYFTER